MGHSFEIICDGGCWPDPGQTYGSWKVDVDGETVYFVEEQALQEWGTNNEAEYDALLWALTTLAGGYAHALADSQLRIRTDSKLMAKQIRGNWACRAWNLRPRRERVLDLLAEFGRWQIKWVPRKVTNAELGDWNIKWLPVKASVGKSRSFTYTKRVPFKAWTSDLGENG